MSCYCHFFKKKTNRIPRSQNSWTFIVVVSLSVWELKSEKHWQNKQIISVRTNHLHRLRWFAFSVFPPNATCSLCMQLQESEIYELTHEQADKECFVCISWHISKFSLHKCIFIKLKVFLQGKLENFYFSLSHFHLEINGWSLSISYSFILVNIIKPHVL